MYLYIQSAAAAATIALRDATVLLLLLQQLLLFVIVCRGKHFCWLIEYDSISCFLCLQTRFIFNVPLGSSIAFTA